MRQNKHIIKVAVRIGSSYQHVRWFTQIRILCPRGVCTGHLRKKKREGRSVYEARKQKYAVHPAGVIYSM